MKKQKFIPPLIAEWDGYRIVTLCASADAEDFNELDEVEW